MFINDCMRAVIYKGEKGEKVHGNVMNHEIPQNTDNF